MYLIISEYKPTSFRETYHKGLKNEIRCIMFVSDYLNDIEELTLDKRDSYIIAYQGLNSIDYPSCLAKVDLKVNTYRDSDRVSLDFDTRRETLAKGFPLAIKEFLLENHISSDLQHSFHGCHLVVKGSDVPKIREFLKNTPIEGWHLDCISTIMPIDGQTVDGITSYTEYNWT